MRYKERDHRRSGHTHRGYPNTETGDMKNQIGDPTHMLKRYKETDTGDPHTYSGNIKKEITGDIKKQTKGNMKKQTGDPRTDA